MSKKITFNFPLKVFVCVHVVKNKKGSDKITYYLINLLMIKQIYK